MTLKISNYNKEELKEALTETQIVGHSIWHEQDLDEKELATLIKKITDFQGNIFFNKFVQFWFMFAISYTRTNNDFIKLI